VLVDENNRKIKFGITHKGAMSQGRIRLDGNIVGFNVIQTGNVDYWGLEMEKIMKSKPTQTKNVTPPCWKKVVEKTHTILVAGNTWVTGGAAKVTRTGLENWSSRREKITTYFKTSAQTKEVKLQLEGSFGGNIQLRVSFGGSSRMVKKGRSSSIDLGTWKIKKAGYQ